MKLSAGILPYVEKNGDILVLLGHMGGPFYTNEKKSYGIIKGEIEDLNEDPIDAAIREFTEETTEVIDKNKLFLIGEAMQNEYKKNIIYGINEYFDVTKWYSNTFPLEWPANSGNIEYFKEMDAYRWVELSEAKEIIRPTQLILIEMLEKRLVKESD